MVDMGMIQHSQSTYEKIRDTLNEVPSLNWSIIKAAPTYFNVSKRCMLCLNEKLAILTYSNQDEVLDKVMQFYQVLTLTFIFTFHFYFYIL